MVHEDLNKEQIKEAMLLAIDEGLCTKKNNDYHYIGKYLVTEFNDLHNFYVLTRLDNSNRICVFRTTPVSTFFNL
jgi:hypothetical protein